MPLYLSKTRFFVITGGRGSSKSFSTSLFLTQLLRESGHKILYTRYTMSSTALSIKPEIHSKIDLLGWGGKFKSTENQLDCLPSKSVMYFQGIKVGEKIQTAKLKGIEGLSTFIQDEADELTDESIFDDIQRSVRVNHVQNRIILLLNPSYKNHWIFKRFFEKPYPNTTYIHTTFLDNYKNLSTDWLLEAKNLKNQDEQAYNHAYLGHWLDLPEGVCHKNWEVVHHWPEGIEYSKSYGVDFGFSSDPTALIELMINKKNREVYVRQIVYSTDVTPYDLAQFCKQIIKGWASIICDSSNPAGIEEIKRVGLNAKPCKKGAGSIAVGVELFNSYRVKVFQSPNIVNELERRRWAKSIGGAAPFPEKGNDHAIDAIVYALREGTLSSF